MDCIRASGVVRALAYTQTDHVVLRNGIPHRTTRKLFASASSTMQGHSLLEIWRLDGNRYSADGAAPPVSNQQSMPSFAKASAPALDFGGTEAAHGGSVPPKRVAKSIATMRIAGRVRCVEFLDCSVDNFVIGGCDRPGGAHDVVVWGHATGEVVLERGHHEAAVDRIVTTRNTIVSADASGAVVVWEWRNRVQGGDVRLPATRAVSRSELRRGSVGGVWTAAPGTAAAADGGDGGDGSARAVGAPPPDIVFHAMLRPGGGSGPNATPCLACFASGESTRRLYCADALGALVRVWEIPSSAPDAEYAPPELCPFTLKLDSAAAAARGRGVGTAAIGRAAGAAPAPPAPALGVDRKASTSSIAKLRIDFIVTTSPKGGASWYRQLPDATAGSSLIGGPPIARPAYLFVAGARAGEHVIQVWRLTKARAPTLHGELVPPARVASLCFGPYDNGPLVARLANGTVEAWDFLERRRARSFAIERSCAGGQMGKGAVEGGSAGAGALDAAVDTAAGRAGGVAGQAMPAAPAFERVIVEPRGRLWTARGRDIVVRRARCRDRHCVARVRSASVRSHSCVSRCARDLQPLPPACEPHTMTRLIYVLGHPH